ncbi:hypothetical protein C8Q74DRAFT_1298787 [Fomes fomentarius]|nr:hypothetical protein C8Q74DRAFT_1298787 [Fomes fomentarius]
MTLGSFSVRSRLFNSGQCTADVLSSRSMLAPRPSRPNVLYYVLSSVLRFHLCQSKLPQLKYLRESEQ